MATRGEGEVSTSMARALADCAPFGDFWGDGPFAASYWVATPYGEFAVVKASFKDRPARLLNGSFEHSHNGGRLCSCVGGVFVAPALGVAA